MMEFFLLVTLRAQVTLRVTGFCCLLCMTPFAVAQAVKEAPREGADPPACNFFGLVPGVSKVIELRGKLGEPEFEASWYAWKMLYPSKTAPGYHDSIHVEGSRTDGIVANIEAATIPKRHATLDLIVERIGKPEFHLTFPGGQHLLDYSSRGVRFTVDRNGNTIGAAYFPHGWKRVHSGGVRRLDLSGLVQGQRESKPGVDPNLHAGAAEVDITPTKETFARKFEVVTPLKARCAVFARGDLKIAVVGADLFGMMKTEIDPIEAQLRARGISHLIFAMSHNHAAPDTIGIYGYYPEKYVKLIQEKVVEGCIRALDDLRPVGKLLLSSNELSLRGARVEGLFRNARNPGIVDPQMAIVQAVDGAGEPIVTLIQFACHVEGLSKGTAEMSADFPGFLCDAVRTQTRAQAVFLNGALGGMVSGDSRARTHEEARLTGLRLAKEVATLISAATPSRSAEFFLRRRRIEVPVTNPKMLLFQKMMAGRRAYQRGRVDSEMLYLRLGEADILTIPGELLPEVSFEILAEMDGYPRMILGLVNDQLGYIIPVYDFRAGVYEESMSMGPAMAPVVKETSRRLLRRPRVKETR